MVHALLLLAVLLGLGSLVKYVPLSVLAGILITVGWGIIDFKGFKDLFKIPKADAVVLIVVFLVTVFVDLLTAVGIGMVIACVLFMKRASDLVEGGYSSSSMTSADLRKGLPDPGLPNFDKSVPWSDEGGITDQMRQHIFIQRLNGPIFFGTINKFKEVMEDVPVDAKVVIIRMKLVSFMDQSGLYAMETAIKDLQARGITVFMTIIQPQPMYMLRTLNVIPDVVPEEHTFKTFEDCTHYLTTFLNNTK
jgi:SulP family sulfate permease